MARYLVTGVAGFIASRVAELLLKDGHTVVGVDNMNDAYDVRMKQHRLEQIEGTEGFQFHQLDIGDKEAVAALADDGPYDAVINLAARAGVRASLEDPWVYVRTNMDGTLNLLELCRHHNIKKFVLASTSSIYGADAPLPTPETANSSTPLQPYAATKKGAEAMCHAYHFLYDIDVTIVRYFTVYGPAGRPDMVMFRFAKWIREGESIQLNGDGEQSRGFTYVDDVARGTILATKNLGFEIINLGGHESITINELIALLEEHIGKKGQVERYPFPKADVIASWANVEKAGKMLGWEPAISLQEGVKRVVDWYEEQRHWAQDLDLD
ncbi:MAG: NAD-dependent epimerase/dehydratase family protein [Chloroflexi bacterium]|nr:MAG: NAD-dependent epimerase/dehydratase family protein [Chloroflexota bacterium]MBL1192828.1 NAD-dependent epimerase/dehydratase family protein [Chloroflexota bacterium]NOH10121.1 NAD-dependent epimerase/dehydratase family protein [Chloroflexota bacterium]